jgi:maltose O-acetyltransferase
VFLQVLPGATLTIGDWTLINFGCWVDVCHEVRIGNHVMLAPRVSILDNAKHEVQPGTARYKGPVVIEDNVWIGQNVVVMSGVKIGQGSVIGANSVVSKDIPPNVFAVGAPARVVRQLDIPDGWMRHPSPPIETFPVGSLVE